MRLRLPTRSDLLRSLVPFLLLGLLLGAPSCATSPPPREVGIPALAPALRGRPVTVTGAVVENRYSLDGYGTWTFVLEEEGSRIECFEAGTNVRILRGAIDRVAAAAGRGAPVTVTGVYREAPWREMIRGRRIEMTSIEVEGVVIDTDTLDTLRD